MPSEDILRVIYKLLVLTDQSKNEAGDYVKEERMHLLIEVCLKIYQEAKKTAIGGIFERVVMGIKQALFYSKFSFDEKED